MKSFLLGLSMILSLNSVYAMVSGRIVDGDKVTIHTLNKIAVPIDIRVVFFGNNKSDSIDYCGLILKNTSRYDRHVDAGISFETTVRIYSSGAEDLLVYLDVISETSSLAYFGIKLNSTRASELTLDTLVNVFSANNCNGALTVTKIEPENLGTSTSIH